MKPLFKLLDGTKIYYGDVLWHPDKQRGWFCRAEFESEGDVVTVRSPNGAVPTVYISELRKKPPPEPKRCEMCNQLLPIKSRGVLIKCL